tara:strand:+ start:204 stop:491 length:288 start_codon:yes stop_codon:yes gene_type:complete
MVQKTRDFKTLPPVADKVIDVFKKQFVKGSFTKNNGETRTFYGQLVSNAREIENQLCFIDYSLSVEDKAKNNVRSINLNNKNIVIENKKTNVTIK